MVELLELMRSAPIRSRIPRQTSQKSTCNSQKLLMRIYQFHWAKASSQAAVPFLSPTWTCPRAWRKIEMKRQWQEMLADEHMYL